MSNNYHVPREFLHNIIPSSILNACNSDTKLQGTAIAIKDMINIIENYKTCIISQKEAEKWIVRLCIG